VIFISKPFEFALTGWVVIYVIQEYVYKKLKQLSHAPLAESNNIYHRTYLEQGIVLDISSDTFCVKYKNSWSLMKYWWIHKYTNYFDILISYILFRGYGVV